MPDLHALVPDADDLVQLDPEELGVLLLQVLVSQERRDSQFHPGNFETELFSHHRETYPRARQNDVLTAVREAFGWLEGQALIVATDPTNTAGGWRRVSRRGKRLAEPAAADAYRKARLLPKQLLHPRIADTIYLSFLRGEYDVAVFKAFKEVEIAVRRAAGLSDADIGTALMRKAFDADKGNLTDMTIEKAEREALAHLFAGAIGSYKNPHSHRTVSINDPADAVEMVMLASHLLRIVDSRTSARSAAAVQS
jgi:uncharacterized protein (TIGR02391 family)